MLSRAGRTLAAAGSGMVLYGVLFGNLPLVAAGTVPLFVVAFAGLGAPPTAGRTLSSERIERGGHVDIQLALWLPRGAGIVEVHQQLPDEFELVEGNNLHVETLGWRARKIAHTFRVRIPKRGEYVLPPVTTRVVHPLALSQTDVLAHGSSVKLIVQPRPIVAHIPRNLRARAKSPYPEGDAARMGIPTNDFKEIRQYVPGDSARTINWKATARNLASGDNAPPLVNETEREGKKKLWIIVDGHMRLSAGTNLEDAREHAADAALSLAEAYLRRGFSVGMGLARSGNIVPERAGAGEAQMRRLRVLLSRLRGASEPSLMSVLRRDRLHFHHGRPLVVLVTRLSARDEDLEAAMAHIGSLTRGRGLVPGVVLDIGASAAPDSTPLDRTARLLAERERRRLHERARGAGLRVIMWTPGKEPLAAALIRGQVA